MPRFTPAASATPLRIEREILLVRGQRVLLDSSLAPLYGVTTGNLNLAVRRNRSRFPPDFLFVLTPGEAELLPLPAAGARPRWGGRRTPPCAFTELGVAMLSSVLRSERAVRMNIRIMRAFVHLRALVADDAALRARLERLETGQARVASVLDALLGEIAGPRRVPARRAVGFAAGAR